MYTLQVSRVLTQSGPATQCTTSSHDTAVKCEPCRHNSCVPYNWTHIIWNCPSAGRETYYQRVLTHKQFTNNAKCRVFKPRRFRCFPGLRPSRQGPTKLNTTLVAQANTSSSHSQQWKTNTKSTKVEILPPRYNGGGANTGSLAGQA
jgi:hypothetical protein